MHNNLQQEKCEIHSLEYLMIDHNLQKDLQNRYLCAKCLKDNIKNSNLSLITDAQKQFEEAKQVFQQRKEDQNKANLGVLKDLSSNIVSLQNQHNQIFQKILLNIQHWAAALEDQTENISELIKEVSFDQYICRSSSQFQVDHNQLKNIIITQLEALSNNQLLRKCIDSFSQFDDRNMTLELDTVVLKEKIGKKIRTPYLPLTCETHQLEIVLFDLNQDKAKKDRIACICCSSGKIGPFTDISTVKKLWNDHEMLKKELSDQQLQKISKIED